MTHWRQVESDTPLFVVELRNRKSETRSFLQTEKSTMLIAAHVWLACLETEGNAEGSGDYHRISRPRRVNSKHHSFPACVE